MQGLRWYVAAAHSLHGTARHLCRCSQMLFIAVNMLNHLHWPEFKVVITRKLVMARKSCGCTPSGHLHAQALDAQRLLSHVLVLRAHSVSEALLLLDQLAAAMHARWSRLRQGQGQGPANQQQQQQQANADGSGWTCIGQRQHGGEAVAGTTASEAGSQHRLVDDTALPSAAMPSVLIVDSVSAVVTPVLGGQQHSQGHALMLSLARMLKQLAGR